MSEEVKSIDLNTAKSFIKNMGGVVYDSEDDFNNKISTALNEVVNTKIDNPNQLQSSVINFKKSLTGKSLSIVDKAVQSNFGISKREGETTTDYISRVKKEFSKPTETIQEVDNSELDALRQTLKQQNDKYSELEGKYNTYLSTSEKKEEQALVYKGLKGIELNAEGLVKEALEDKIISKVYEAYDFKKDERGRYAVDKRNGNPVLDGQGNRIPIDKVTNNFIQKLEGVEFKKPSYVGSQMPRNNGSDLSEEQILTLRSEAEKVAHGKGIYSGRQFWKILKDHGVPLTDKLLNKFPDLK